MESLTPDLLRPDQLEAIDWLKHRTEAFVILPIGFGKTIVTLTAIKEMQDALGTNWRTLIVSTKNIVNHTWRDEIASWSHLQGYSYESAAGRKIGAVEARPDFLGINFESLEWLLDRADEDPTLLPEILVIDESSKMKSHSANRVKRLIGTARRKPGTPRPKAGEPRGYVYRFKRRFALSATPNPEGHQGLWSQEACVSLRRRLGKNITEFRDQFCRARWNGVVHEYEVTKQGKELIEAKLSPISYAPKNQKYMDLPDPIHQEVIVPWSKKARGEYEKLEQDMFLRLDEGGIDAPDENLETLDGSEVSAGSVAVLLNKLRQASSGFVYDESGNVRQLSDPGAKLRALEGVLERAAESPILVFTQYVAEAEAIRQHFDGAVVGLPETLDDWNAGRIPMLVLHPRSAGHGLNLERGAHVCVFYSLPWSYEDWFQAWGRLHRTGQQHQVSVLRLMRPDSVDADVWSAIRTKERRLGKFIESMRERREG